VRRIGGLCLLLAGFAALAMFDPAVAAAPAFLVFLAAARATHQ
jgi:hypothetical protein